MGNFKRKKRFFLEISGESEDEKPPRATPQSSQEDDNLVRDGRFDIEAVESIALLQQPGGQVESHNMSPLEALLGGGAGFPPLLDIPPDADDETMVELAIALSLQEHELGNGMQQGQQGLHSLQVEIFKRVFNNFQLVLLVS